MLPDLKEKFKKTIDALAWSKLLPIAANILNTIPSTVTGYAPYFVHKGYLSQDIFEDRTVKSMKKLWRTVYKRLQKQRDSFLKKSTGPFPNTEFNEGAPVFAHLPGQNKVPCIVLKDFGDSCLVDKGENEPLRFRTPVVHKSMLTKRIDGVILDEKRDPNYFT